MEYDFSYEEFVELSYGLERHHGVFDTIWRLGKPIISTDVNTAAIQFDGQGETVSFLLNPDYWKESGKDRKEFIICHECLHVLLEHGKRAKDANNNPALNITMDIIVNHLLIDSFDFKREKIDPNDELIWLDKVFDLEKEDIEEGRSFEYYYAKIKEKSEDMLSKLLASGGIDQHDMSSGDIPQNMVGDLQEKLNEELSDEDKDLLKRVFEKQNEDNKPFGQQAGTISGGGWIKLKYVKVKKKRKWETVIKEWALKQIRDTEEEQWIRINRRFVMLDHDFMLPTIAEVDAHEQDKITVFFFQDTSGSCYGYHERFFKAASSLPEDKFSVKMHCFDTKVFETTLESGKLYGFGGTSFSCIESYIQQYINKNKLTYPKAVFIITDGWGDDVNPRIPNRWYWFLTPYSSKGCIPKDSHIFNLSDYE